MQKMNALRMKSGLVLCACATLLAAAAFAQGTKPAQAKPAAGKSAPARAAAAPAGKAGNDDVIRYRQHIMDAMNEQAAILGQIASGAVPNDNVVVHLESMALLASTALKAYEKPVQGGEAKPEVWKNWDDFSRRMREFAQATDAAAKLVSTQGPESALSHMMDSMGCRGCHRAYRVEK